MTVSAVVRDVPAMEEWLWRGGPRRWAVVFGFVGGLLMIGVALAVSESAVGVVAGGLIGWVLFFALAKAGGVPGWRRGEPLCLLSPSERVAVIRAVRNGEPVPDPRLAPSVLAFARVVMSAAEQQQRQRWKFFVLPALLIAFAVGFTVAGSVRLAAYFWALTAFSLIGWLRLGSAGRRLKAAGKAARIAEDQITRPSGTSC